jgi:hypothetical protein
MPGAAQVRHHPLMEVFPAGDEATIRRNLLAFIAEMDDRGEAYGYGGDPDGEPSVLWRERGVLFHDEDQHVILVLSGSAAVAGAENSSAQVSRGDGVLWGAGEAWSITVHDEPLYYLSADGPALTSEHFRVLGSASPDRP